MDKLKVVLIKLFSIGIITLFLTAMIRSFILHEWIFAGAYMFILISLTQLSKIQKDLDKVDNINKFKDSLDKLKELSEKINELKEDDNKDE